MNNKRNLNNARCNLTVSGHHNLRRTLHIHASACTGISTGSRAASRRTTLASIIHFRLPRISIVHILDSEALADLISINYDKNIRFLGISIIRELFLIERDHRLIQVDQCTINDCHINIDSCRFIVIISGSSYCNDSLAGADTGNSSIRSD